MEIPIQQGSGGHIASLTGPGGMHSILVSCLQRMYPLTSVKDFDWPKLQAAWPKGKAHGSTASVVTEVATSSDTPHVATEDGLTTKHVTFAVDNEREEAT